MCGIVGIIAKKHNSFTYKMKDVFQQMLFIDTLRGEDSTGIYAVNRYGNVQWHKEAADATTFMANKSVQDTMKDIYLDYVIAVGHNRKATKGAVKDENAHPFVEDDYILVHNGTLTNHKDLNDSVEVDSHAIAHTFNEHGIEGGLAKIQGAFALAVYCVSKKEFYLTRNKDRPMWLCETDTAWIFASEPWIAYGAMWRNGTVVKNMHEIKEGTLVTFNVSEDETKISVKDVELYKPPVTVVVTSNVTTLPVRRQSSQVGPFLIGQAVTFVAESVAYADACDTVKGMWDKDWNIVAYCGRTQYTKDETALFEGNSLVGEVQGVNEDKKLVYVKDLAISIPYVTRNGIIVDEEYVQTLDMICSRCKDEIEEEDLENTYLRVAGGKKVHICPKCTEESLKKNPNWGGIKNYEKAYTRALH